LGKEGTLKSADGTAPSQLKAAIAVLADTWWQAKCALDMIPVEWDEGDAGRTNSDQFRAAQLAALDKPGKVLIEKGDAPRVFKEANKVYEAVYETPFLDHAIMEPICAVAHVTADHVDLWVGTQQPARNVTVASQQSGMPPQKIFMHDVFVG